MIIAEAGWRFRITGQKPGATTFRLTWGHSTSLFCGPDMDFPASSPPLPVLTRGFSGSLLLKQLGWIVDLRWVAGSAVLVGGLAELFWLHWYGTGRLITALGAVILAYNVFFWIAVKKQEAGAWETYSLVWGQILADIVCLSFLVAWTGEYESPLRGFFVFHMVFASLLLPRMTAFGAALVAIGMVEGILAIRHAREPEPRDLRISLGWDVTLVVTVYLAGQITQALRRQRRRLARQNRRISRMAARLQSQQQAMAQHEKMVAVGQMAAGVAHEVANPLASMDGLLQLLERRPEKATSENFARLREQVARINQIVRQLTAFSRPEAGEWREANLNEVVNQALSVLSFDKRVRRISIEKVFDPALPAIYMQPAALEQVVMNLVINAADAMEETAAPQLALVTAARDGAVDLIVRDNGQGIPEKLLSRIFEPFFTTKPVGRGTGLGLSISYTLVQKHGGEIRVVSVPGAGATFTVSLPIRQPAEARATEVHS